MKFFVVLVGLVLVAQNVYGGCICGINPCGNADTIFHEQDMCHGTSKDCVPMVVRPRDLPKPAVPVPILGLGAVPGPCIHKKAIVKPAVVPKPVLRRQQAVVDCTHAGSSSYSHASSHAYSSYGHKVIAGVPDSENYPVNSFGGPSYEGGVGIGVGAGYVDGVGGGFGGVGGGFGVGGFGGVGGAGGIVGGIGGGVAGVNGIGPNGGFVDVNGGFVPGPVGGTPADAVSVALAYKMARQQMERKSLNEDRLSFGFRKMPVEVPQQRIERPNVPEENLFSLNGQIVELKPVNLDSQRTLDEEAADDLLALEADETDGAGEDEDITNRRQLKKIYLEEIGYGPAKVKNAQFVDVPTSVGSGLVEGSVLGGSALEAAAGHGHGHGHSCGGCNCCNSCKCKEFLPGGVEYRVVPKVDDIIIPAPPPPDSCESAELNISEEKGCDCQCKCLPICVKNCHKCAKSTVFMSKLSTVN